MYELDSSALPSEKACTSRRAKPHVHQTSAGAGNQPCLRWIPRPQESPRRASGEPRRGPGEPRRAPGEPRRAQESPRRAQGSPGELQESPGGRPGGFRRARENPRRVQDSPGGSWRAIGRPGWFFWVHGGYLWRSPRFWQHMMEVLWGPSGVLWKVLWGPGGFLGSFGFLTLFGLVTPTRNYLKIGNEQHGS